MKFSSLALVGSIAALCLSIDLSSSSSPAARTPISERVAPLAQAAEQPAGDPSSVHRATLTKHCVTCHNSRVRTAGLALDSMDVANVATNRQVWEKVVRKLGAGLMPPAGLPRPDPAAAQSLVSYLETSLDRAAATAPDPGHSATFRRLNRTEYQNAVRDLLAVDVDAADLLPPDDSTHGFDNISVSNLSPTLTERYLVAAKEISRLAVGAPLPSPVATTITVPDDRTQDDHFDELPFGTRGGVVVEHTFPRDGEYTVAITLGRDRNGYVAGLTADHQMEVMLDGERIELFTLPAEARPAPGTARPTNPEDQVDANLKSTFRATAGRHVVGVTFVKKNSALIETERQPWFRRHAADYADQRQQPVVYSVNIAGPFADAGPGDTASRQRIFRCRPASPRAEGTCARSILSSLARLAYRRAVTDRDIDALMVFYDRGRAEGDFEAGVEAGVRALLTSPHFLFRIEQDPAAVSPDTIYRLSDVALASRLSFFLWSSIPDEELLTLAIRGALSQPATLERQVRRMLADPRSHTLVTNFAGQWLYLRNLAHITPDPRAFPDFDDLLREGFRKETELFFESIIREDRSLLDLLRADYTFVNERVAKHYGIPNVYGSRFRRVHVEDERRRGLLGHGSVLTVTSYATRTSPVLRGKWILENILGTPPPPPPPDVPPLPDSAQGGAGKVLTMRERMASHRSNPVCATCHSMIDPAGFALEYFDAVGRWRVRDEAFHPIDGSGVLPDGSKFDGVIGLRTALLGRPRQFVTTVTEKLLTYALGRGIESYDMPAVRSIVRDAEGRNYSFSAIVIAIAKSTPFQMKRSSAS